MAEYLEFSETPLMDQTFNFLQCGRSFAYDSSLDPQGGVFHNSIKKELVPISATQPLSINFQIYEHFLESYFPAKSIYKIRSSRLYSRYLLEQVPAMRYLHPAIPKSLIKSSLSTEIEETINENILGNNMKHCFPINKKSKESILQSGKTPSLSHNGALAWENLNGTIHQIEGFHSNQRNSCLIGVRCGHHKCSILSIIDPSSDILRFKRIDELVFSSRPYHIAMNPFLDEEIAILKEDGSIHVWQSDVNHGVKLVLGKKKNESERAIKCEYGSHLRSLLLMSPQKITELDFRVSNTSPVNLVWIPPEEDGAISSITAFKRDPINPFQIFLTDKSHLWMIDQRYTKIPLFRYEEHLLNPTSIQVYKGDSRMNDQGLSEFILTHNFLISDVRCYHLQRSSPKVGYSFSSKLKISPSPKINDPTSLPGFYKLFKKRSYYSVSYLAGVCVSQSRNCGIFNGRNLAPDLTIFQCSKIGDIICHQFQIKDYSPTNIMTCGIIDKELDFNFNSQFQKRYLEPMTYSPVINRKRTNKLKRYDLSFLMPKYIRSKKSKYPNFKERVMMKKTKLLNFLSTPRNLFEIANFLYRKLKVVYSLELTKEILDELDPKLHNWSISKSNESAFDIFYCCKTFQEQICINSPQVKIGEDYEHKSRIQHLEDLWNETWEYKKKDSVQSEDIINANTSFATPDSESATSQSRISIQLNQKSSTPKRIRKPKVNNRSQNDWQEKMEGQREEDLSDFDISTSFNSASSNSSSKKPKKRKRVVGF